MNDVANTRHALSLTQTELAALLGLHYVTVCRWERGHMTPKPWVIAIFERHEFGVGQLRGVAAVEVRGRRCEERFRAAADVADIGGRMSRVLAIRGPLAAMYLGLAVSYGRQPATVERDLRARVEAS